MILASNGEVRVHLDDNNDESSEFRIYNGADVAVLQVKESGIATFSGAGSDPDIVLGGRTASDDDGRLYSDGDFDSSDLILASNDEAWIHLDNNNDESSEFRVYNGDDNLVFSVTESGAVTFAGAAATAVRAGDHGMRSVYAVQATGNWVEDFGTAQLAAGEATVQFEPVFAQTVNLSEYQVFVTPLGDCPLYVSEKAETSFTVRASGGQRCGIGFDYRIVARQRGYEDQRLERIPREALERSEP
jgi:hypothetical protein